VNDEWIEPKQPIVSVDALEFKRAKVFCAYILSKTNPHLRFVEVRKAPTPDRCETIVFDVNVDRPSRVVHDIRYTERIAVIFESTDSAHPEVLALRSDFPSLPHTNLRLFVTPKSLCLYDRTFEEVRTTWTPESFALRIQDWLSKSALGELHDPEQPLEPFLPLDAPKIVLPASFYQIHDHVPSFYEITLLHQGPHYTYIATETTAPTDKQKFPPMVGCQMVTPEVTHGVINHTPVTFGELTVLLSKINFDLIRETRSQLQSWHRSGFLTEGLLNSRLALFIIIPQRRREDSASERIQPWVFGFFENIRTLGEDLGVWLPSPEKNKQVGLLLQVDETRRAESHKVHLIVPVAKLTPTDAARMNGDQACWNGQGVFVGVGALGGYTIINLLKTGFGSWTLVDSDIFLPHNCVRHFITGRADGYSKAGALTSIGNEIFDSKTTAKAIIDDILDPKSPETVDRVLHEAQLIIDCTASVPAARKLTHAFENASARRASLFLSPNGYDLVLLAESADRSERLDAVEMQYLRALCEVKSLDGHLATPSESSRYARTCADVSSTIPNEVVTMHAAIASVQIKALRNKPNALVKVWRCDPNTYAVQAIDVATHKTVTIKNSDWTVVTDEGFLTKLRSIRKSKLPTETGGTLIGSLDLLRHTIYVVDTLPTPSDSTEDRAKFIRGRAGNSEALTKVQSLTSQQLTYVGEWHSHPSGASTRPSGDDIALLQVLESRMHPAGLPAAMLILGDDSLTLVCTLPKYTSEPSS
jgi:hypothetical protein